MHTRMACTLQEDSPERENMIRVRTSCHVNTAYETDPKRRSWEQDDFHIAPNKHGRLLVPIRTNVRHLNTDLLATRSPNFATA